MLPPGVVDATPVIFSDGRSAFTAVTPCRLADTRDPASEHIRVSASTIRIQVVGQCGIAAATSAVAVSVTATATSGDGYAVVAAATTSGPTSTINWSRGETRAASTVVALSPDGALDVHVSTSLDMVDVIVDVTGAWALVAGPVRAGRLVSSAALRVVDTRTIGAPIAAGQSITIDRAALGIPDSAVAVAGTLTTTAAAGAGFLTAYPAGTAVPPTSNVNTDQAGQHRAAGIVVALSNMGLSVHAGAASAHIVLDVTGYVTGDADPASTEGLLIAVAPRRMLDTRTGTVPAPLSATVDVSEPFPSARVAGVVATVTATNGAESGYAAFGTAQEGQSPTSALNWPAGAAAVAAMTIQPVSSTNTLTVTSSVAASFIVDVTGYLLAANAPNGPERLLPGATALPSGVIDDTTGVGRVNGDPVALLSEVYSTNVLAAGGAVSIVNSIVPGGGAALVPYEPSSFPDCGPQPRCIIVSAEHWDSPLRGGRDANRVMISHEWAHVLSMRYQTWVDDVTFAVWQPRREAVNEECLADAVATVALQRAGLPGNETPTYIVHYMCDDYWAGIFGAGAVTAMRAEAHELAIELLEWAEAWGTAHPN